MRRLPAVVSAFSVGALLTLSLRAEGQTPASVPPHVLVIKMISRPGPAPYAFDPATTVAQRGDTLRFVETSGALHNVRFTKQPPGAKLGAAATTPYLTEKGQTYDVVITQRFAVGTYEYVCDPHVPIGMKGTLIVK